MVLICSENRKEYGFGHRSRALALMDCLESLSIDYKYIVNDIDWKEEMLKQNKPVTFLSNFSGDQLEAKAIIEYIQQDQLPVRLIFCDGNRFSNTFLKELSSYAIKIVLIDDIAHPVRDNIDFVWNPNIYATTELYKDWEVSQLYLGVDFLLLRKEFFQKNKSVKKSKVFISQGGIVRASIQNDIEEVLLPHDYTIEVAQDYSANQMVKAIDEALITICGASVTLHEAWVRGAYTLPLDRAKDQTLFSQFLLEKNIPFLSTKNLSKQEFKQQLNLFFKKLNTEENALERCKYQVNRDQNKSLETIQEIYFSSY